MARVQTNFKNSDVSVSVSVFQVLSHNTMMYFYWDRPPTPFPNWEIVVFMLKWKLNSSGSNHQDNTRPWHELHVFSNQLNLSHATHSQPNTRLPQTWARDVSALSRKWKFCAASKELHATRSAREASMATQTYYHQCSRAQQQVTEWR